MGIYGTWCNICCTSIVCPNDHPQENSKRGLLVGNNHCKKIPNSFNCRHTDEGIHCGAQICIIISSILSSVSVSYGNGRHFNTLTTEQQEGVILWMMSAYVPGIPSLGLGKLAVIALLTRLLFPGKLHYWALWISGSLCVATLVTTVTLLMLQCSPPRVLWDFSVEGKCLPVEVLIGISFLASSEYSTCCARLKFVMPVNSVIGSSFFSISGFLSRYLSRIQIT